MSPQFVDFDADGHLDIVAGTFSGSPWIARGAEGGWRQPEMILDAEGERIVGNQYWCYDEKQWKTTERCDPKGGAPARAHLTSAFAMDWDGDGDHDLLLGDYDGGFVYLRRNEGTNAAPEFAFRNELVEAGAGPLKVDKTSTMRVLDWNGDGRDDLLVSSMGDTYGQGAGGGVYLYLGQEERGGVRLAAAKTLVRPSKKGHTECVGPDAGLYVDAGDVDGDGDLDLLVGAYSMWSPPKPELDDAQRARAAELRAMLEKINERSRELNREWSKAIEGIEDRDEQERVRKKILEGQSDERKKIHDESRALRAELDELEPGDMRVPFVWLFENERIDARVSSAR